MYDLVKHKKYENQLKLVRITQAYKDLHGGKEFKERHKKAQRKLSKYQRGDFENVPGDYVYSKQAISYLKSLINDRFEYVWSHSLMDFVKVEKI